MEWFHGEFFAGEVAHKIQMGEIFPNLVNIKRGNENAHLDLCFKLITYTSICEFVGPVATEDKQSSYILYNI